MTPLPVLFLSHTSEISGAEMSLLALMSALDRGRFEPRAALPGPGPFLDRLIESGIPFKWAQPQEGLISYVCGLSRANRPTSDEELVYDFINANMTPESGAYMIEAFALGSANMKAYDLVTAEVLERNGLTTPEESLAGSHTYQFVPVDLKQEHISIFDEIRAGF